MAEPKLAKMPSHLEQIVEESQHDIPVTLPDATILIEAVKDLRAIIDQQNVRLAQLEATRVVSSFAGMILTIAGAGAVLSSVSQTPVKITQYNLVTNEGGGLTADEDSGVIGISETGVYSIQFWSSFSISTNNRIVHFQPHINGSVGLVEVDRFLGTGSDIGVVAFQGVITFQEGTQVDMRAFVNIGSTDFTFEAMGFSIFRVGAGLLA